MRDIVDGNGTTNCKKNSKQLVREKNPYVGERTPIAREWQKAGLTANMMVLIRLLGGSISFSIRYVRGKPRNMVALV